MENEKMFGKERDNEWNIVEWKPTVSEGYTTHTRKTTIREGSTEPEISEYSLDYPKWETEGTRYAYRLIHFPYPLLRANGVSPIRLVDAVNYTYSSGKLKSFSTGLAVCRRESDLSINTRAVGPLSPEF